MVGMLRFAHPTAPASTKSVTPPRVARSSCSCAASPPWKDHARPADLVRRVYEHRTRAVESFTSQYGVEKLVWFEIYDDAATAIAREKELKKWRCDWKIRLIEEQNRGRVDLYPG